MFEGLSPASAFTWVTVASAIIAVLLGIPAFAGPVYKYIKNSQFQSSGLIIMFFGLIMVTTPKWTEVAVKFGGFEGKIAALKSENVRLASNITNNEIEHKRVFAELLQKNSLLIADNKRVQFRINEKTFARPIIKLQTSSPRDSGSILGAPMSIISESDMWKEATKSDDLAMYRRYLQTYPDGAFAPITAAKLKKIDAILQELQ